MHAPSIAPIGADGPGPRRRSQTLQAGSKEQSTTAMPQTEPRLPSRARMLQRGPRTGEPIAWAGQSGWMHRPSCPVASKSTPKQARPVLHLHTKSWFVERGHVKMHQRVHVPPTPAFVTFNLLKGPFISLPGGHTPANEGSFAAPRRRPMLWAHRW